MRQDSQNPAQGMHQDEIALDGVRYANLHQAGQQWRIGAVNPAWRQELLALPGIITSTHATLDIDDKPVEYAATDVSFAASRDLHQEVAHPGLGDIERSFGHRVI